LRAAINKVIKNLDFTESETIFSTTEDKHAADDYFLASGDKIRFFWEERARKNSKLICAPELAINKIGHNLHDLVPEFEAVSYDTRVATICKQLGMAVPLCV
jgi:phytanoyl-CoA hydroxylase